MEPAIVNEEQLVTLGRFAELLPLVNGRRLDRRTLARLAQEGRFRSVRFGRRLLVPAGEAEALVRQLGCGRAGA